MLHVGSTRLFLNCGVDCVWSLAMALSGHDVHEALEVQIDKEFSWH
jgi:hypothetical protein